MKQENFFALLMIAIIGISFYFFYLIFSPYLVSIAWAVILTLVFYPAYERLNGWLRNRRSLSSILSTVITILIIVFPGVLLLFLLAQEVVEIYRFFEEGVKSGKFQFLLKWREAPGIDQLISRLDPWLNLSQLDVQGLILQTLRRLSTFVLNQSTKFVLGFSQLVFSFFLMAISMFYLFRDGERLLRGIKSLIPLTSEEKELVFVRIREMVHATIFGGVLVSMIQGFLGGLAFWILGLPSPVLWGSVMALLAFVPVVGPFLVWIPAAILLVIQGQHYVKAIVLVVWGIVLVGLSDNFLRPILISGRTKLHTMILFFAVLGGLNAFGFLGLVAGPLVVTVCLAILDIYSSKLATEKAGEGS
ncbi:MAG: AI-2E family transporter [Proteobacteria bacterium]|nr:AI-2E family transporter [Pseudomonadota bacterium]NIS69289.1 AI-2E family transporter [Pseudomonadota bacterium]